VTTVKRRSGVAHVAGRLAWLWLAARLLGALALLSVGAVHLQQYQKLYSAVPTIGPLFLVNFAAATVLGIALLAPLARLAGRRGRGLHALAAAGGIGLAAGSFVMLVVAEHRPLFGFREPGYDPTAIAASRGAETATVLLLGLYLSAQLLGGARRRRKRTPNGST
jgi:hypothetical protein